MIPGRNQWATHVYMCQITFSRRHPYEPPSVSFPMNTHNLRVPKAPKVDGIGRLRIDILSLGEPLIIVDTMIITTNL